MDQSMNTMELRPPNTTEEHVLHEHEQNSSGLASLGRFLRHLLEMIVAMFIGMGIYAVIFGMLLAGSGYGDVAKTLPELRFGLMGIFMAAPMVLLMRVRGHSWERGGEMAAAMLAPMIVVALCWRLGMGAYLPIFADQAMPVSAHVGMYLGMVAVMLYRRKEYTHPHGKSHMEGAHVSA
jgi:hypothetical protein